MINKIQILDYIQVFVGIILGLSTKVLENITLGDIRTVFAVINICSLLVFIQGVMNIIEDKYGIRVLDLRPSNKRILSK